MRPAPTVRAAHHLPLFMSGPNGLPLPEASHPGTFNVHTPEIANLVARGFTPDEAEMIYGAGVSGLITREEWQAIKHGGMRFEEIANAIFGRAESAGLSGLGQDETYMPVGSDLIPPAIDTSTYMDFSNVLTPPSDVIDTSGQLQTLLPGAAYPTAAELTPSYSAIPSTLTPAQAAASPSLASSVAQLTAAGVNMAQAANQPFTPAQIASLRAAAAKNAAQQQQNFLQKQSISGIPNVALLVIGAIGLLAVVRWS